jgi:hypothetical protein
VRQILPHSIQQASLLDKLVEQTPLLDEFLRGIELLDLASLENDNPIAVEDGDDGTLAEEGAAQRGLQQGVGLDIDGCGGFVEDEDVGGREQRTG